MGLGVPGVKRHRLAALAGSSSTLGSNCLAIISLLAYKAAIFRAVLPSVPAPHPDHVRTPLVGVRRLETSFSALSSIPASSSPRSIFSKSMGFHSWKNKG